RSSRRGTRSSATAITSAIGSAVAVRPPAALAAGALAGAFVFVTAAPSPASNAASSSLDRVGPPPTRKILSQCWQRLGLPYMLSRMSISFPQLGQFVLKGMAVTSEADGVTNPRPLRVGGRE